MSSQLDALLHQAFAQALPDNYMSLRSTEAIVECQDSLRDVLQAFVQTAFGVHRDYIRLLNNNNSVNRLPPELLPAIFQSLPLRDRIRATHVCHHWRVVALSAPSLWSVISCPTRGSLLALPELVARSSAAPLDLCIPNISRPHDMLWALHVVKDHGHRLQSLLLAPTFEWPDADVYDWALDSMPLLRDLYIKWSKGPTSWLRISPFAAAGLGALEQVELVNVDAFDCFALFTSVTRLSLNLAPGCTTYQLISHIAQCRRLQHLELTLSKYNISLAALTAAEATATSDMPSLSSLTISGTLPRSEDNDPAANLFEALRSHTIPSVFYPLQREGHHTLRGNRRAERLLLSDMTGITHFCLTHLAARTVEVEDERGFCRTAEFVLRDFDDSEYRQLHSVVMLGLPFDAWCDLRAPGITLAQLERLTITELPVGPRWRHARWATCPKLRSLTLGVGDESPERIVEAAVDTVEFYIRGHPMPLEQVILVGNRPQRLLSAIRELPAASRDQVRGWEALPHM
ncbi:hypothetical protein EXIGLDRAFT_764694 [Exidia glandulosa HHB12029]|uniref:F-box domain-containing protein n=1 Tax=Exidia glandulosa HHB12029 TaxID=1314781 RepID=A0A165KYH7_EXIGL|nr:hypothetical protein EXIGLDRAFT_764694 [Exidia glandulosa HHB12029]